MDSPLLSPRTETCETRVNMFALPPALDPNEQCIVPVNESPEGMPSDEQPYRKNPSIYRVPAYITNLNPEAHQPQVVSFGPYHHGEDRLRPMEEHKHRACDRFLGRCGKSCAPFLESLREVVQDLKDSYIALDPRWKEDTEFLKLMIRDGCFMLEIMRTTTTTTAKTGKKWGYPENDPIFNKLTHIKPYIRRDMLKLENQLPMLVLYQLVTVESNGMQRDEYINDTNKLILRFYSRDSIEEMGRCLHVVDIYRKSLLIREVQHEATCWSAIKQIFGSATEQTEEPELATKETERIIRPATELNETGIQFKESPTHSLKDITFARGILKLPVITVNDATKSMFLNLMTFERLHIDAGNEISSYVTFMDNIINNERDVALLHTEGIIQNGMGSDKEIAKLFNSLCKEVTLASNGNLGAVEKQINVYCKKTYNKWRANLNHTYFGNPWTILSLLAAIFLFTLTIIQTVYAVLSYY